MATCVSGIVGDVSGALSSERSQPVRETRLAWLVLLGVFACAFSPAKTRGQESPSGADTLNGESQEEVEAATLDDDNEEDGPATLIEFHAERDARPAATAFPAAQTNEEPVEPEPSGETPPIGDELFAFEDAEISRARRYPARMSQRPIRLLRGMFAATATFTHQSYGDAATIPNWLAIGADIRAGIFDGLEVFVGTTFYRKYFENTVLRAPPEARAVFPEFGGGFAWQPYIAPRSIFGFDTGLVFSENSFGGFVGSRIRPTQWLAIDLSFRVARIYRSLTTARVALPLSMTLSAGPVSMILGTSVLRDFGERAQTLLPIRMHAFYSVGGSRPIVDIGAGVTFDRILPGRLPNVGSVRFAFYLRAYLGADLSEPNLEPMLVRPPPLR